MQVHSTTLVHDLSAVWAGILQREHKQTLSEVGQGAGDKRKQVKPAWFALSPPCLSLLSNPDLFQGPYTPAMVYCCLPGRPAVLWAQTP